MTLAETRIEKKVAEIVAALLAGRGSASEFSNEGSLVEAGIDSADMVNLLFLIEEAFKIEVPSKEVNLRNFFSVQSIAALVEKSIPAAA